MKNILLTLFLIALSSGAYANTTITALPTIPSPGVVLGTSVMAIDQNSTGTLTTYQASFNTLSSFVFSAVNPVCSLSGMPTVCGSFFGFVLPQWYGGFCGANWNQNNNVQDDAPSINAALASGLPVYIGNCKIATPVQYSADHQLLFSFTNITTNDTFINNYDFAPGGIFLPNNLGQLCAIDQFGWDDIGMRGIHIHANNQSSGSAGVCNTHAIRNGQTDFFYINYLSVQNMGMGFGGPTNSSGVPQIGNTTNIGCPDGTVTSYGCDTQVQIHNFTFAHLYWGIRANFSDSQFSNFFIANTNVAIASYNRYTGGASFNNGRIEYNGPATIGTSSLYPQGDALASGVVSGGGYASWDMTNIQFEQNSSPDIDIEGGGSVQITNGHDFTPAGARTPFDSVIHIGTSTTGGGSLLMSNFQIGIGTQHPAYGIDGASTSNGGTFISVVNSNGFTGATSDFNFSAQPTSLFFQVLGRPIYDHGSSIGVRIGTAAPISGVDIGTQGLGIGSGYAGVTAAPINGAIIQGNVGIGTTSPLSKLGIVGLGTTAPIGTTTGSCAVHLDSAGNAYCQ